MGFSEVFSIVDELDSKGMCGRPSIEIETRSLSLKYIENRHPFLDGGSKNMGLDILGKTGYSYYPQISQT